MMLVNFSSILAVPAIIICTCMGCGSGNPLERQPISGAVTINGTPLEKGSIQFEPLEKKGVASGAVITAGKYSIPETKGLPTGKYKVLISSIGGGAGQDAPKGPPGTAKPVRSVRKRETHTGRI